MAAAQAPRQYWDPGNLLQVTDDTRGGVVQCVGSTKKLHAARCRYTINDAGERAAALASRAARRPADVGRDELRRLAVACLCVEHHRRSQPPAVTDKWVAVVRRAALHHDGLLEAERERLRLEVLQQQREQQQEQQTPPPSYSATQAQTPEQGQVQEVQNPANMSTRLEIVQARLQVFEGVASPAVPSAPQSITADSERAAEREHRQQLERNLARARRAAEDGEAAQARLVDVEKSYVQLRSLVGAAQEENATLRRQLDADRQRAEKAQADTNATVASLEADKAVFATRLNAAEAELEAARGESGRRLAADAAELRAAKSSLGQLQAELEETRAASGRAAEDAAKDIADLRAAHSTAIEALESAKAASDKELQRITAKVAETAAAHESAAEELRKVEAEAEAARAQAARLAAANERMHAGHVAAVGKLATDMQRTALDHAGRLEAERRSLATRHAAATEQLVAAREEARRLAERVEECEAALGRSRAELRGEKDRAAAVELQVAMCRLHGLGTWFGRHSKREKHGQKKLGGDNGAAASDLRPEAGEVAVP